MLIQRKIEIPSDIHSIDFIPVIILPYFKMLPIVYDKRFSQRRALKRKFFNQHSVIKLELNKLLLHT